VGKGWYGAAVVAALLVLLTGCVRPVGQRALQTVEPSATPVAGHGPLTIMDVPMHDGEVGVEFAPITMAATGGVAPYHWAVSVGSLPGGLTLTTAGVVSGTPASNGFFQFSVQVFDADSDTAGLPRTIGIVPRLSASLVPACATECSVELGCVTVCGAFGQVTGGVSPLTYKLTNGALPSGTSLSGMALKGTFTGLPGRLSFAVQVTDGFGITASLNPTFNLFPHLSMSGTVACNGGRLACTATLSYSGGNPATNPKVGVVSLGAYCPSQVTVCPPAPKSPPGGFSATAGNGAIAIMVPAFCGGGAGGCPKGYLGAITIRLSDGNLCSAGTYCMSGTAVVDVYML
jgi:hypothetical protein